MRAFIKNLIHKIDFKGGPENSQGPGGEPERGERPGGDPGGSGGRGGSPFRSNLIIILIATMVMLLLVSMFLRQMNGATSREITYSEFIQMLEEGKVKSVKIKSDSIEITPVDAPPKIGRAHV